MGGGGSKAGEDGGGGMEGEGMGAGKAAAKRVKKSVRMRLDTRGFGDTLDVTQRMEKRAGGGKGVEG